MAGIGWGHVAKALGPARSDGPSATESLAPKARKVGASRSRRRCSPAVALRTRAEDPEEGAGSTGINAAWPVEAGSVFDPNTDMSSHSG
jgi:hypothetical protein